MYTIYLVNFGYTIEKSFNNLEDAIKEAKRLCYESVIRKDGERVATYHPLSGVSSLTF